MDCKNNIIRSLRTNKSNKAEVVLPQSIHDCHLLVDHNYTMLQLKSIAKTFSLKQTGTKSELTKRIYEHMYYYPFIVKIQNAFRRKIANKYRELIRYRDTVNDVDFLTMDKISELPKTQFFSFKEKDGFVYGFDAMSFYQLIFVNKILTNPYTRSEFQTETIEDFNKLVKYASFLKMPLNIIIEKDEVTPQQQQELKVVALFQKINSLGNYADSNWFMKLNITRLFKFLKDLNDIWHFRAQLTDQIKRAICPSGNPFRNIRINANFNYDSDIFVIRRELISVIDTFINSGIDKENQTLGSYYVLSALTLVSHEAAVALPWLYQSVQYY